MMGNALWTDPINTGITFGIILVGWPVYYAWRAWAKTQPQMDPDERR
jgi:hypothetical protein